MTIIEAIQRVDALIPNAFEEREKIYWLSTLDAKIKTEVIDIHEFGKIIPFREYDENTDTNTELLAPSPYSELYLFWLEAKIHYYNNEMEYYNNAITMFNYEYEDYKAQYHRSHNPFRNKRGFHH